MFRARSGPPEVSPAYGSQEEARREEEADRVDEDRERRREPRRAGRPTRGRRAARRAADLELRVPVDELVPRHERGQVRLVCDVEEDRADADEEPDDVELPDRERVERVSERDRREERGAPEVADDEDRLAPQPVDPDSRREREEHERAATRRRRGARPRTRSRRAARIATSGSASAEICEPNWLIVCADQSLQEVPVAPEAAARPEPHVRHRPAPARGRGPACRARRRGSSSIGSGISRRWRCGENRIQRNARPPPIAPIDDRLAQADPGAERAAGERSERDRPPDDEAHDRVHPALEPRRADGLPVAHLA